MTFGLLNKHKKCIFTLHWVCGQNFKHLEAFFKVNLFWMRPWLCTEVFLLVCINTSLNLATWLFIALQSVSYAVSVMQCTAYIVQCVVCSVQYAVCSAPFAMYFWIKELEIWSKILIWLSSLIWYQRSKPIWNVKLKYRPNLWNSANT